MVPPKFLKEEINTSTCEAQIYTQELKNVSTTKLKILLNSTK
jgi:hypothetical protein